MAQITAIIETAEKNYSAYVEGIDGIAVVGSTLDEIKMRMAEALEIYIETCKEFNMEIPEQLNGDYELNFRMDVQSLLGLYTGIFTKSGLQRITGINQKQLWHYASGLKKPKQTQTQKIESALHKLGSELMAIRL